MRVTISQLSLMIQPIGYHVDQSRPFSVYESLAPLFYLAARNEGIELLDVIYALRRCTLMTYMLTAQVLQDADIETVKLGILCIQADDNPNNEMLRCITLFENWIEQCEIAKAN